MCTQVYKQGGQEMADRKSYPSDLTDEQWAVLGPLIPPPGKRGRPREVDMREVLNTLLYQCRTGCQWRYLPTNLLPKSTVWYYFNKWKGDGTWQAMMDALRRQVRVAAGREEEPSAGVIDTQSVKTHHQGAQSDVDGNKNVKGRKRHIVVDMLGLVLAVAVTPASLHDGRSAPAVLGQLGAQAERRLVVIFADSKYNTEPLREWIVNNGKKYRIEVVRRPSGKFVVLKKRWVVERTYAWACYNRRLSKDYERTTSSSEAWFKVSMIHLMLKRLAPAVASKSEPEFKYRQRRAVG
jgi:putative transposase